MGFGQWATMHMGSVVGQSYMMKTMADRLFITDWLLLMTPKWSRWSVAKTPGTVHWVGSYCVRYEALYIMMFTYAINDKISESTQDSPFCFTKSRKCAFICFEFMTFFFTVTQTLASVFCIYPFKIHFFGNFLPLFHGSFGLEVSLMLSIYYGKRSLVY